MGPCAQTRIPPQQPDPAACPRVSLKFYRNHITSVWIKTQSTATRQNINVDIFTACMCIGFMMVMNACLPLKSCSITLPCRCTFPHITYTAFECLCTVFEGADATVPKSVVCRGLGLSFWPARFKGELVRVFK